MTYHQRFDVCVVRVIREFVAGSVSLVPFSCLLQVERKEVTGCLCVLIKLLRMRMEIARSEITSLSLNFVHLF